MLMWFALAVTAVLAAVSIAFLLVSFALGVLASIAISILVAVRRTRAIGIAAAAAAGAGALITALLYASVVPTVFHADAAPAATLMWAIIGFAWIGSAATLLYGIGFLIARLRHFAQQTSSA